MATKMDLKTLFQKSQKGNDSEDIQQFQSLSTEEMGQEVLSSGKHNQKTFQVAYQDKSYVKWCVEHTDYEQSVKGMKKWLVYLRRRLELEVQAKEANESGDHPKTPVSSGRNKAKNELRTHLPDKAVETKIPMDLMSEMSGEWDPVATSKLEILEGELMHVSSRLDQVEGLNHRMNQVEGVLQEILTVMKSNTAA